MILLDSNNRVLLICVTVSWLDVTSEGGEDVSPEARGKMIPLGTQASP